MQGAQIWITLPAYYLLSVHQMAPPLTEAADILLQPTAHLPTPKRCKAEWPGWLTADGYPQVVTRQLQVKRWIG